MGPNISLTIRATSLHSVPIALGYIAQSTEIYYEVIYAFIILCLVYILIVFDVSYFKKLESFYDQLLSSWFLQLVHRAIAAILGSMAALAVMSVLNLVSDMQFHRLDAMFLLKNTVKFCRNPL